MSQAVVVRNTFLEARVEHSEGDNIDLGAPGLTTSNKDATRGLLLGASSY